jgi:hypothetical protein
MHSTSSLLLTTGDEPPVALYAPRHLILPFATLSSTRIDSASASASASLALALALGMYSLARTLALALGLYSLELAQNTSDYAWRLCLW